MRHWMWATAVAAMLALVGSASAQTTNGFFGPSPSQITYQPINTSDSVVPIASPITRSPFGKLLDFFPSFSFGNSKPIIGQSIFPTGYGVPKGYLRPFGYQRAPIYEN